MLVEGRIKQPPSTRSVDSICAAGVWSAPSPASSPVPAITAALQCQYSRPSVPERSGSHVQSVGISSTSSSSCGVTSLPCRIGGLPLVRVRHWFHDLICKLLICLATYFVSSVRLPSVVTPPVSTLLSISVRPTSTQSLPAVRSKSFYSHFLLISLIVMTVASVGVHCLNSHSPSQPSQHSTTHANSKNHQMNKMFEKHLLNLIGLKAQPRLPPNHKVPEYMLDLYHWFRFLNQHKSWWLEDQSDSHSASAYAITSEDLPDVIHSRDIDKAELDEEETQMIEKINNHHRAPSKRRPSQHPRVTLLGPANTIISHKLTDHDNDKLNRRRRSTESALEPQDKLPSEEVHLKFDIHLPDGEFLKGAELRLYRHSIFEHQPAEDSGRKSENNLARHQNHQKWPLYHWSVRYRSEPPNGPPLAAVLPYAASNNSHLAEQKHSSGEGSARQVEHKYMQRINVYHLLRPIEELQSVPMQTATGPSARLAPVTKLIDTQVVDVRQSGWLSFDIFPAMDRWTKHPDENFGLLLSLTDSKGREPSRHSNLVVVNHQESHVQSFSQPEKNSAWHEVQPLVITFSNKLHHEQDLVGSGKPGRVKREHKRSGKPRHRHSGKGGRKSNAKKHSSSRDKCSRHPLYFDFHMVGWMDWIVAPPGFQAHFCQGECSFPMEAQLNITNHATIQGLVNSVNRAVVPPPCCVPTDLSPITLLYHDVSGKVVLTNYHDMVVEGCGCR